MVNNIVLLINLVGLLLVDSFFLADLNITQNIPAAMEAGTEVRVTVNIEKGELAGFAKLQLDVPAGLHITAIETKGASFTFAEQKAKFIWMALPTTPTFKITYTLKADAGVSGAKRIEGRFSFIENNERKTFELAPASVAISNNGATPVAVVELEDDEDISAGDLVSAGGGAPVSNAIAMAVLDRAHGVSPIQGAGGVNGERTITPITGTELMVEVVVKKGDIRGFGKLQETIPLGFTAVEKTSDEAIFTTQDRIVKFVWLNLPARNTVTVTYLIRANSKPDGEYSIDGEFGYLLNDETQKAVLGTSKFFTGAKALELLAQDESNMTPQDGVDGELALREKARLEAEARARDEALAQLEKEKEKERIAPAKVERPTTSASGTARIPAPEKGITYKVQITAAHREVGASYFRARHRYTGDFSIERHEGWVKYVTGRFSEYSAAREQRIAFVQAGHEFPGPFVTAYNNGERITVQEALMLSAQKWVP